MRTNRVAIAEMVEHLGRALHSMSFSSGLNPAQWNALRYLSRANPSARNITAFARHHLTKKSAASDTISALISKGLVLSKADPEDARAKILDVTATGYELLAEDPFGAITVVIQELPDDDLEAVIGFLERSLRSAYRRGPNGRAEEAPGEVKNGHNPSDR